MGFHPALPMKAMSKLSQLDAVGLWGRTSPLVSDFCVSLTVKHGIKDSRQTVPVRLPDIVYRERVFVNCMCDVYIQVYKQQKTWLNRFHKTIHNNRWSCSPHRPLLNM